MSAYIIHCPHDGAVAIVRKNGETYELECPVCHRSETAETIARAAACFIAERGSGERD